MEILNSFWFGLRVSGHFELLLVWIKSEWKFELLLVWIKGEWKF